MTWKRDQRGDVIAVVSVLVVLAGLGIAVSVEVARRVMTDTSAQNSVPSAASTRPPVFIGPAPDVNPKIATCQIDAAKKHGVNWAGSAKGWRGVYPDPDYTEDVEANKALTAKSISDMNGLVNFVVRPDWVDCKGDLPPGQIADPEPPVKIPGQYDVESTVADSRCKFPAPKTVISIVEKPTFTITIRFPPAAVGGKRAPVAIVLRGTLTKPDLTFSAHWDETDTGSFLWDSTFSGRLELNMRGRFDSFNRRTIIREGVGDWTLTLDNQGGTCRYSYGATRQDGSSG